MQHISQEYKFPYLRSHYSVPEMRPPATRRASLPSTDSTVQAWVHLDKINAKKMRVLISFEKKSATDYLLFYLNTLNVPKPRILN